MGTGRQCYEPFRKGFRGFNMFFLLVEAGQLFEYMDVLTQ